MNDEHGYTLAEALTALLIVALTMAALAQAANVIRIQTRQAEQIRPRAADLTRAQRLIATAPQDLGPYFASGTRFAGDGRQAAFDCAQVQPCALTLTGRGVIARWGPREVAVALPAPQARLRYVDDLGATHPTWPRGEAPQRLTAIVLIDGQTPLAVLRLSVTTSAECLAQAEGVNCGNAARGGDG